MGCLKLDILKNHESLLRVVGKISTTKKRDVDYYPFGSLMPSRNGGAETYRYGFIGQENDNEVKNVTGGSQYHSFRSYDSRLGRYMSRDPLAKTYVWNSPYAYAENRVIDGIDLEGLEYQRTVDGKLFSGPVNIKPLNAEIIAEKGASISSTDAAAVAVFNTFQSGKYTGYAANPTTQPDLNSSNRFLNLNYISNLKDGLDLSLGATDLVINQMVKANIEYGTLNSGKGGSFYKNFYGNQSSTMTGGVKGSKNFIGKVGLFLTVADIGYGVYKINTAETQAESTEAKQGVATTAGVAGVSWLNPFIGFTLSFGLVVNGTEEVANLKEKDKKAKAAAAAPIWSAFQKIKTIGPAN